MNIAGDACMESITADRRELSAIITTLQAITGTVMLAGVINFWKKGEHGNEK